MANAPYKYEHRIAKDRQILIGLAELSLGERFERLQNLKVEIQKMEESLANKRSDSQTEQQKRAILADEDGLIELKCRFALERSEYLARKAITPDFREPAGASGETSPPIETRKKKEPFAKGGVSVSPMLAN